MRKWVLNHAIPLCNACFSALVVFIVLLVAGCGSASQTTKESRMVVQYQRTIGCRDYARLRPAEGNHEQVLEKCMERLHTQYESAQIVTAFVYRSLNKGVLFVHLVFRQGVDSPRQSHNYLVRAEELRVMGGYPCGM